MKQFIPGIVASQKLQFEAGSKRIVEKRKSWNKMAENAIDYFETVQKECKSQKLFEAVYVLHSQEDPELRHSLPHITLFFGQHPLGYNGIDSNKLAAEGGCSLTIAQSVFGDVICTYSPFKSPLASRKEKYLIANRYNAPWEITDLELDKITRKFFTYAQISSVYGHPCTADKFRFFWMRLHHWWLHFQVRKALLGLVRRVSSQAIKSGIANGA